MSTFHRSDEGYQTDIIREGLYPSVLFLFLWLPLSPSQSVFFNLFLSLIVLYLVFCFLMHLSPNTHTSLILSLCEAQQDDVLWSQYSTSCFPISSLGHRLFKPQSPTPFYTAHKLKISPSHL